VKNISVQLQYQLSSKCRLVTLPLFSLFLLHSSFYILPAQAYQNVVNDANIRTVQFYRGIAENSFPYLTLNGDATLLTLEFDRLSTEALEYQVQLVHCNANWQPSELIPVEFLEGPDTDYIREVQLGQATKHPYVHYRYQVPSPNSGMRFRLSGNYALLVASPETPQAPVLVRRFVVVEGSAAIGLEAGLAQGGGAARFRTQQVNFNVMPGRLQVNDPLRDFQTVVLQNFRWDNAAWLSQPTYVYPDRMEYVFQNGNYFNGGNEFRLIDLRTIGARVSPRITRIQFGDSTNTLTLMPDRPRAENSYFSEPDFNGGFYIAVREFPQAHLLADYFNVRFTLQAPIPYQGSDVFLFGALTDWSLDSRFKLQYDPALASYTGTFLLKQGVYDYQYVLRKPNGVADEAALEGSHFETENYYTVLVYYRSFSDRADRCVALKHVNFYDR
jgi:hypothetical protein